MSIAILYFSLIAACVVIHIAHVGIPQCTYEIALAPDSRGCLWERVFLGFLRGVVIAVYVLCLGFVFLAVVKGPDPEQLQMTEFTATCLASVIALSTALGFVTYAAAARNVRHENEKTPQAKSIWRAGEPEERGAWTTALSFDLPISRYVLTGIFLAAQFLVLAGALRGGGVHNLQAWIWIFSALIVALFSAAPLLRRLYRHRARQTANVN